MNKKEQITEILRALVKKKNGKLAFEKLDIETAIMECRGCDNRTVKNWWLFLWRMGFFTQTRPNLYILNVDKLVQLESPDLLAHQTTLAEHTHTQSSKGT